MKYCLSSISLSQKYTASRKGCQDHALITENDDFGKPWYIQSLFCIDYAKPILDLHLYVVLYRTGLVRTRMKERGKEVAVIGRVNVRPKQPIFNCAPKAFASSVRRPFCLLSFLQPRKHKTKQINSTVVFLDIIFIFMKLFCRRSLF